MSRATLVLLLGIAACSSGSGGSSTGTGFPAQALTTSTSQQGKLRVEVRTAPDQPPVRGTVSVELRVSDASSGLAIAGLGVSVVPWMPAMGHGGSTTPTVVEEGGGRYVAKDADLFMPGRWELRTTFTGPVEDHATPAIDVQ